MEFYAVHTGIEAREDVENPLESLFRLHYARLVRTLTLASGNEEHAADAVQEAFVKAHLHWWRIKRYEDPVGWIRRVAINRLRDLHRHTTREDKAIQRLGAQPSPQFVLGANIGDETRTMVSRLPRQQAIAVSLFYLEDLSVAEVASAMSLSPGAVKFHLHEGRERLRRSVPSMDPGGDDEQ